MRTKLLLISVLVVALLAAACSGDKDKPTILFADQQFESLWINNAIAKFVIENGYGNPVVTVEVTTPIMQASIANGDLDVALEMWQQNWIDNYNEETAAGNIINICDRRVFADTDQVPALDNDDDYIGAQRV